MLNIFRRSLGNSDDVNLSDSIMLTEDVGSIISCSLRERTNLVDMVDEKVSSIRVRGGPGKIIYQLTSSLHIFQRIPDTIVQNHITNLKKNQLQDFCIAICSLSTTDPPYRSLKYPSSFCPIQQSFNTS